MASHPPGYRFRMRALLSALALPLALAGCGSHDRAVGETCQSNGDCISEMCVTEMFAGSTCKDPCGGNDANCEPGYACTGRAAGNVAYCEVILDE